MTKKEKEY